MTVMITPLKNDGSVDYEGFKRNIDWQIGQGIHGLIALGSTGEFAALEDDEKKCIAEFAMKTVGGRVPVIIGTTAETTEKTIQYSQHARDIGAAGVMVLPSYYCKPDQEEMFTHFARVADAVDMPVMIYNNPWSSGVDMQADTVARLARHNPNLAYIKESTADMRRIRDIIVECGDDITAFCGWEDLAFESFVVGAKGWVCVIGNIAPAHSVKLFDLVTSKKDYGAAWELYKTMLPMLRYLEYSGKLQQTLKYSLDRMGLAGGPVKSPRLPLGDESKKQVDVMLKAMGLI
jgi:4-hydroxy-tetrahydrodipicolinate synthase